MDYKDIVLEKVDVIKMRPYHDNRYLEFWTPAMYVPYGLEHHEKFGDKYEVKLSFRNESGMFLKKFMNKINAMDAYFKHIHKGTEYFPMVKGGSLVIKVPYMGSNFQCSVKSDFEPLPTVFSIKKGCWVRCLVRADRIWKYQNRSGCLLVAKQFIILNQVESSDPSEMVNADSLENE